MISEPSNPTQIKSSAGRGQSPCPGRQKRYESKPAFANSWTRPLLCPKGSKLMAVTGCFPNFSRKYALPVSICRIKDSPQGILQSGCKYQPPMMCHFPFSTSFWIRANSAGSISSIHLYSTTSLWLNTRPSYSSQKTAAIRKVEMAAAIPSSISHSHTGSIWALQIKCKSFILISPILFPLHPRAKQPG